MLFESGTSFGEARPDGEAQFAQSVDYERNPDNPGDVPRPVNQIAPVFTKLT
jgi:hypothetical protein